MHDDRLFASSTSRPGRTPLYLVISLVLNSRLKWGKRREVWIGRRDSVMIHVRLDAVEDEAG